MPVLALLLFIASVVAALGGLATLTQATMGVGSIALACYLAIVARLAQASGHYEGQAHLLRRIAKGPSSDVTPEVHVPALSPEQRAAMDAKRKRTNRIAIIAAVSFLALYLIAVIVVRNL
jgi:hypothetical protein